MTANGAGGPAGRLLGPQFVPPPQAAYATKPSTSRGRFWPEPESETRTCYQRDRDRIVHSAAFRRLKHKTQVFVQHEGDYFRTRLTHSLEVAQIARSLARVLGLNEDLAEALSLAHDLGHPPFGHAGEHALNQCMKAFGGFDHNAQTLALVTRLEHRYAAFDGLNLTWETLEGLVKHNGPLIRPGVTRADLPRAICEADAQWDLQLESQPSLEAQIAALSDDIAYLNHDIDDGLRAGLFSIEALGEAPLAGPFFKDVQMHNAGADLGRLIGEGVRRLITAMIRDVTAETARRIDSVSPRSVHDVRQQQSALAAFSPEFWQDVLRLKDFLFRHMYRHERVMDVMNRAQAALTELFAAFLADPSAMPEDWAQSGGAPGDARTAQAASDYIAGMTDRFLLQEYQRIFHMEFRL
jgi:dGTPase